MTWMIFIDIVNKNNIGNSAIKTNDMQQEPFDDMYHINLWHYGYYG